MTGIVALDGDWRSANPLPTIESGSDKNSRGRVLLVGGARFVPGALALTGEAVLRAGAGKLQMATVEAVASALGVLVPEAAMVGLPMREDGEGQWQDWLADENPLQDERVADAEERDIRHDLLVKALDSLNDR